MLLLGVGLVLSFGYLAWVIVSGALAHRMIADKNRPPWSAAWGSGGEPSSTCLWLLIIVSHGAAL